MVEVLLTTRSTADSVLSLRIIMEHKKGHISHESGPAADNRTQGRARPPASECPVMFVARRDFWLLGEQTKWRGQGAKRPGAERVATCPGLSGATPLNRPLQNRPSGKTTPPSINHSNYKAEKEKHREKKRRRGVRDVTDRKTQIGKQAGRHTHTRTHTEGKPAYTMINTFFHLVQLYSHGQRKRDDTVTWKHTELSLKERGGSAYLGPG